ncbi:putative membrane protein [Neobacillus niacini]|nr:putative membrane protein [Neobacillus niacini]
MEILIGLVILILIFSVVSTLFITGKPDKNYTGSTKRNTTNLTLIYVVIIFLALVSLGIYIWMT